MTKCKVNVREAELEDLNSIVLLLKQLSECTDTDKHLLKTLSKILNNPLYYLVVAEKDDDEIVGTAMLVERLNLSHGGRSAAYIEKLVVDANHRQLGIGAQIMEEISRIAYFRDCYKITLNCYPSQMHFFRNFNFHRTNEDHMRFNILK